MLKFAITPYASTHWSWNGTTYITDDHTSQVTPHPHPMLEPLAITDGVRSLLVVRERLAGRGVCTAAVRPVTSAEYEQARDALTSWPADYLAVETAPRHPVTVTAGAARTTPLYLAHRDGVLHGSWDLADLRAYAGGLSAREAARLLVFRPRYGAETLFTGIRRLTERATATYGGTLHVRYPAPALHARPRGLIDGADAVQAFTDAIDTALDAFPLYPTEVMWHLSGGLDSGTIASRAAQRWPGQIDTSTLLVIGPGREQQIRRRKQMLTHLPFSGRDLIVDVLEYPLFSPQCARIRGELISPYDEPLHPPFAHLIRQIAQTRARVVVTGLGGDEMVALSPTERGEVAVQYDQALPWLGQRAQAALEYADDDIAPPAGVSNITLLSLETTAPALLRAGLWPVHPFTHPAMVRLGEQLPIGWRDLKVLQRRTLGRWGLDEDVCTPVERENFEVLVRTSLERYGTGLLRRMLTDGSPLLDEHLVDADGLTAAVVEVEDGGCYEDTHHSKLLEVIHLDAAARAFLS